MYGEPALPHDFVSLPYANPDAPKGGTIVLGNTGGFDSLNPYIAKGTVPWQLRFFTHESLMGRTQDEPFALYGLIAESINTNEDRTWVEFTLRPEATFSDDSPITVEDVIWSFETLGTEGHPRYRGLWSKISSVEQTGPSSVRFTFGEENRELALLVGMRPILQKSQWKGKEFADAKIADIPMGSGPYVITKYDAGRSVQLTRNEKYWGADLPLRRGTNNFDQITLDFYGDSTAQGEAFKAGQVSAQREFNAERWNSRYEFPRALAGNVVKTEIPHKKPSGMTGFVMNSRRAPFDDWRVREALIQAFNFEFINGALTGGAQPRITSYFSNSLLAMQEGQAQGRTAELLAPFAADMPPGLMEGYVLPVSNGSERNRQGLRNAIALLKEAGWEPVDGMMQNADGESLSLTILLAQGKSEHKAIADLYLGALKRLGIIAEVETVDNAQYVERTGKFDFDVTYYRRSLSLSPGNEQQFYWGSPSASMEGSRNLMGAQSSAVDAMVNAMLKAGSQGDFVAAVRGLDRALMTGRYVIPFWQFTTGRIAHVKEMKYPENLPIYGDGPYYMPEVWWWED
ncbi:extracellular solute-binding protein [Ascidiaceihabitans sp.]|nr:extracellular solute-binding protein [Ascidiaceihabitans sp.]